MNQIVEWDGQRVAFRGRWEMCDAPCLESIDRHHGGIRDFVLGIALICARLKCTDSLLAECAKHSVTVICLQSVNELQNMP